MFTINHEVIANIPVLHVAKQSLWNEKTPAVFFIHGFTSAKEHNLHYAYLLSQQGFRVFLPEVYLHGERSDSSITNEEQFYFSFWDMVIKTIQELDEIKNEVVAKNIIDESRIGIAGVSMGGIVTLGALKRFDWIKAAVSLMGCPSYEQFANALISEMRKREVKLPYSDAELENKIKELQPYDLSLDPTRLQNRALLFWHGKADPVVPYDFAYQFYEENKELYKKNPKRFQFYSDPKAGHKVSRQGVLDSVQWFQQFL